MISPDIIQKIKSSTCAIAHLPEGHAAYVAANANSGNVKRPQVEVIGTGFLIRPNLVLTNRHVILPIIEYVKQTKQTDRWYIILSYPKGNQWTESFSLIGRMSALADMGVNRAPDAGIIEMRQDSAAIIPQECQPVEFAQLSDIQVGMDIGICGYPLGSKLLISQPTPDWLGPDRMGALIHQGIVSGLAPWDSSDPRDLTRILTDLNTAGGMSGSPIFELEQGKVIGLHHGGTTGTLGLAYPVDQKRVDGWVKLHHDMKVGGQAVYQIPLTASGDVTEKT